MTIMIIISIKKVYSIFFVKKKVKKKRFFSTFLNFNNGLKNNIYI